MIYTHTNDEIHLKYAANLRMMFPPRLLNETVSEMENVMFRKVNPYRVNGQWPCKMICPQTNKLIINENCPPKRRPTTTTPQQMAVMTDKYLQKKRIDVEIFWCYLMGEFNAPWKGELQGYRTAFVKHMAYIYLFKQRNLDESSGVFSMVLQSVRCNPLVLHAYNVVRKEYKAWYDGREKPLYVPLP